MCRVECVRKSDREPPSSMADNNYQSVNKDRGGEGREAEGEGGGGKIWTEVRLLSPVFYSVKIGRIQSSPLEEIDSTRLLVAADEPQPHRIRTRIRSQPTNQTTNQTTDTKKK